MHRARPWCVRLRSSGTLQRFDDRWIQRFRRDRLNASSFSLAALLLALTLAQAVAQPAPLLAGYHESWAEPRVATPDATRLARLPPWVDLVFLAFARPDARYRGDFDLRGTGLGFPFDGRFARDAVRALRQRHPAVKLLLSVGGATYGDWSALEAGALARLVVDLELDGLDVDFEPAFPGCRADAAGQVACASDAPYIAAVRALRLALPRPYLLAVAGWSVGAHGEGAWREAQPRGRYTGLALGLLRSPVAPEIDLLGIMAYDAGPRLDPLQAFAAYRARFGGRLLLGFSVQDMGGLAPAARLDRARALAAAVAAPDAGVMLYSLQMTHPQDQPGNRQASGLARALCEALGKPGCAAPLP